MDLRQLKYLVALADEQHFTRAAAREHIAQPALSQQIRRLEQEVGLALVERTTRRVTVTEQSSEELAEMLRDDVLDLAFLSVTERIESHGLGLEQLVSEELVVVLPCDHRLAGRGTLRMAELADEHFISYREGARLRELLTFAARHAGFEPQIKLESNESERIKRLVARHMGVAILPRSDAERPGIEVAVAILTDPALRR